MLNKMEDPCSINRNNRFAGRTFFVAGCGRGTRESVGLPPGSGPYKVISTLALIGYDPQTKRMRVENLHPGVTKQDVVDNTSFEMLFDEPLLATREPTDEELHVLREEVDPQGLIIGKQSQ